MKTLYLTFFYANLIPVGFIISFFGLIAYYWSEKVRYIINYEKVCNTHLSNGEAYSVDLVISFNDGDVGLSADHVYLWQPALQILSNRLFTDVFFVGFTDFTSEFFPANVGHR